MLPAFDANIALSIFIIYKPKHESGAQNIYFQCTEDKLTFTFVTVSYECRLCFCSLRYWTKTWAQEMFACITFKHMSLAFQDKSNISFVSLNIFYVLCQLHSYFARQARLQTKKLNWLVALDKKPLVRKCEQNVRKSRSVLHFIAHKNNFRTQEEGKYASLKVAPLPIISKCVLTWFLAIIAMNIFLVTACSATLLSFVCIFK